MNDPMNRLTPEDDLQLKTHSILPNLMTPQGVWVFDEPLPKETWIRVNEHLAAGFGSRRVRRTRIPFARDWWDTPLRTHPVDFDDRPVPENGYLDWIWEKGEVDLDPYEGSVYRLSVSPTAAGGQIISYVVSHVVLDGLGGILAVGDTVARMDSDAPPSRTESAGRLVGTTPAQRRRRAHLADARGQLKEAGRGMRQAWGARKVKLRPRNPRPELPRLPLGNRWIPSVTMAEISMAEWNRVAAERGGTVNALYIGVLVGLYGRIGRVSDGDEVCVVVPHSTRVDMEDPRGNALSSKAIWVTYREGTKTDLGEIRRALKASLSESDVENKPAAAYLGAITQMAPQFLVPIAAKSTKSPELLCSNLGNLPQVVAGIQGKRAKVAFGLRMAATDPDNYRRWEAGLMCLCGNDGETMIMQIAGLDPDRFPTRESLEKLVVEEFNEWGLHPTFWG
ncbi:condensation domain-containing protein [Nocardia stercoris]|uniref:Diacylglycerol O-acyltransferase n=1 Tax=Nocardia stercoris TaxID=2483361 RepID=A0A3M2L3L6_9NOCA|nr:hypothetical protein [Nocardia stercoris]RMI32131.1 hypothetical protein EBN03_14045 [Nocardia stercoris]